MKRFPVYALALLLPGAILGLKGCNPDPGAATAAINVRIYYAIAVDFVDDCSKIKVVATPKNGAPIEQFASGDTKTQGGCTASLKNVPADTPIELKALTSGKHSEPEHLNNPPAGKWKNPITLKPGETDVKYLELWWTEDK